MPKPRNALICLHATPYDHCAAPSSAVRTASASRSFEHRSSWIEQQLLELADVFAIDIATKRIRVD